MNALKTTALMLVLAAALPAAVGHSGSHQNGSEDTRPENSFAGIGYSNLDAVAVGLLAIFTYGLLFYCAFFFNPEETSRGELLSSGKLPKPLEE